MSDILFFPFCFYYFHPEPPHAHPQHPESHAKSSHRPQSSELQQRNLEEKKRQRMYFQIFERELQKNKEKYEKKNWKPEQDHLLVQLREKGMSWVEVSKLISKTNPQICKRRHARISEFEKKWPRHLDQMIKHLYEFQGKRWSEIYNLVYSRSGEEQAFKYSLKKLKERYFLHLRAGIEQREWEVEEDLKLLRLVKENGKKWKQLTRSFHGRTELQLKNRFNGTLKLIEKRVMRKLNLMIKTKAAG